MSPDYLAQLKDGLYATEVVVSPEDASKIEREIRCQQTSELWERERRNRIAASKIGTFAKMRKTTLRSKKVEEMLYRKFKGNKATKYGTVMESTSRQEYLQYHNQHGHKFTSVRTGLVISLENPWLAASPDDQVHDEASSPHGVWQSIRTHSVQDT